MKQIKYFFFLILAAQFFIFADSIFEIRVIPRIISEKNTCMQNRSFDQVFIKDHFFYFLEDNQNYTKKEIRKIRGYFDNYSFNIFNFKNNKLVREFYVIMNRKEIKEGFYKVHFKITKTIKKTTFCIHEIHITDLSPLAFEPNAITNKINKFFNENMKKIIDTDILPLFQHHKNVIKIKLRNQLFFPDSIHWGVNAIEHIGQFKNHFIFRFKLENADTEKAKKEGRVARGYYCYIDYDKQNDSIMTYFTIVSYSIYKK